jgi:hypothetical protein
MSFLDACLPIGIIVVLILVFHLFRTVLMESGPGRVMTRREEPDERPRNETQPSATCPEERAPPRHEG